MTAHYKVLVNGQSAHGGHLSWSLPTLKEDGEWLPGYWQVIPNEQAIDVCRVGLHLTNDPARWLTIGCEVYLAAGRGDHQTLGDKTAWREARLLRPAPEMIPDWWRQHEQFVIGLKDIPWGRPDGNPNPEWVLFTAPTLDGARAEARAAADKAAYAREVIRDMAYAMACAVAEAAADARDAVYEAACDFTFDAAYTAAALAPAADRDVAFAAAYSAFHDAVLYTSVQHICGDLDIEQRHRDCVEARWEVWRKGYWLAGEVEGTLFVYSKEEGA
ncbi:MAG: hypothetical protein E6Q97_05710 [Desulfurellales bacterium]|nr:MAG: hypothetical protein E6Q97_05710 [Desulfurellales bacterium]